ncbi:MAG: AAA domain-containing protein [Candidatus Alkanophagales archaeon]
MGSGGMFEELVEIIEEERGLAEAELRDRALKQAVPAEISAVSENLAVLSFGGDLRLDVGDVIGYVSYGDVGRLGVVVEARPGTLLVSLEATHLQAGDAIRIFESESLISYDLQLEALQKVWTGGSGVEGRLYDLMFGDLELPELRRTVTLKDRRVLRNGAFADSFLDDSQVRAVESILSLEDGEFVLIIGPPGTGKTQVIAKAAYELAGRGEKVLITSHTNRAVDTAIENLPLSLALRVGRPERVLRKEYLLGRRAEAVLGERLRELRRRISSAADVGELSATLTERSRLLRDVSGRLVETAPIIGATLIKSQLFPLRGVTFDTVLIDECSQASIPLALLGALKARKWVFIGDHRQMLPIFRGRLGRRRQERYSAFNHLLRKYRGRSLWLERHYRSHAEIIGFSQRHFYEGRIEPVERCRTLRLDVSGWEALDGGEVLSPEKPVVFVHVEGEERRRGGSRLNDAEAEACVRLARMLAACLENAEKRIAIITPYDAQKKLIRELAEGAGLRLAGAGVGGEGVEIDTVDAFQGRQKDVVIFSVTSTEDVSFAADPNRLNVAFTRPIYKLIVVGNVLSAYKDEVLASFVDYCLERRSVYGWEERRWVNDEVAAFKDFIGRMLAEEAEREYRDERIYVSELGGCMRRSWFRRKLRELQKPNLGDALRLLLGRLFHELVEESYSMREVPVVWEFPADAGGGGGGAGASASGGGVLTLAGRIDAVDGGKVVEFKSKSPKSFSYVMRNGPLQEDEEQVRFYAAAGGYERALLIYHEFQPKLKLSDFLHPERLRMRVAAALERGRFRCYEVDLSEGEATLRRYEALASKLHRALVTNTPPEGNRRFCKFCEFRELCEDFERSERQ